jgi:hypothetical protein
VAHGVRAVYSSPLLVGRSPIGALNLYATAAGARSPRIPESPPPN